VSANAVTVSRRIEAPAETIFRVLANPARHPDLDGSGMLRSVVTNRVISTVGDVFVMKMYFDRLGDYEMNNRVVEFEPNRRIAWEPEPGQGHPDAASEGAAPVAKWGHWWAFDLQPDGEGATIVTEIYDCSLVPEVERQHMDNGRMWIPSMTATLERLEALCVASLA
jgi:uncharacterized protein YndB with AHSA1/START domain